MSESNSGPGKPTELTASALSMCFIACVMLILFMVFFMILPDHYDKGIPWANMDFYGLSGAFCFIAISVFGFLKALEVIARAAGHKGIPLR